MYNSGFYSLTIVIQFVKQGCNPCNTLIAAFFFGCMKL